MSIVKKVFPHAGAGLKVAAVFALIVGCRCTDPVAVPPVPSGVKPVATSETAVSVSWDAAPGAAEYVIYRDGIALDTIAQTQFAEAGLATCAKYSYQVAALNSGGISQLSPAVSVLLQPSPIRGTGGMLLQEPNGCISYKVGDTMAIDWELDTLYTAEVIRFSADSGLTFFALDSVSAVFNRDSVRNQYQHGPYLWVIPDSLCSVTGECISTVSDSCIVNIHEYWATGKKDVSDRPFRITAR